MAFVALAAFVALVAFMSLVAGAALRPAKAVTGEFIATLSVAG